MILPANKHDNLLKAGLRIFLNKSIPVPVVFVKANKLKDMVNREKEKFHHLCSMALYRGLIKTGCVGFFSSDLPIIRDRPCLIIGLIKTREILAMVGSLDKELAGYHSVCKDLRGENSD